MSKQKLILPVSILLGCIVLGGFFYLGVGKDKNQKTYNNTLEKNEQFDKNLECQRLMNNAEKIAQSFDIYAPPRSNYHNIMDLFYSHKTNSCLVSFTHSNGEFGDEARQYYKLYDLFSFKLLIDKEAIPKDAKERTGESFWDDTNEIFRADVNEYK